MSISSWGAVASVAGALGLDILSPSAPDHPKKLLWIRKASVFIKRAVPIYDSLAAATVSGRGPAKAFGQMFFGRDALLCLAGNIPSPMAGFRKKRLGNVFCDDLKIRVGPKHVVMFASSLFESENSVIFYRHPQLDSSSNLGLSKTQHRRKSSVERIIVNVLGGICARQLHSNNTQRNAVRNKTAVPNGASIGRRPSPSDSGQETVSEQDDLSTPTPEKALPQDLGSGNASAKLGDADSQPA
ncbi:hypothetical protein DFH06DRAFT_1133053 [Mycena polygramma]|nr:hypothetical protein DFH06DRAFT_1133053 [Mycena polygramma]